MIVDPSASRAAADLDELDFISGQDAGRWRVICFEFPVLDFAIAATEVDGSPSEYGFRAELSNYPGQAPMVQIWDHGLNALLATDRRPQGGPRVLRTFQRWGDETIYRPWDRKTGPHNNNAVEFPHLAWHPERHLSFIFEDLYVILNSNSRTQSLRASS
ncbi:MAG: hypothetical protein CVU24_16735 [Betaproteobacteria bacterium HGW-Betaproteobacteria-18]|jgi:hypothetical protein|nr:MAG: hypothetical protein CVU24_16735 [Betaproteobacteria bacterium HGW-Betaproteobacteria-18]